MAGKKPREIAYDLNHGPVGRGPIFRDDNEPFTIWDYLRDGYADVDWDATHIADPLGPPREGDIIVLNEGDGSVEFDGDAWVARDRW